MVKAAVMFSGGIDSTTVLAKLLAAKNIGLYEEVYTLSFDDDSANYRTRRSIAIEQLLTHYGITEQHHTIKMYNSEFLRYQDTFGLLPGYKMVMQISCMAYCQKLGVTELHMGYNKENENYAYTFKDELKSNIIDIANLYNKIYDGKVEIHNMYVDHDKAFIIDEGHSLHVPFEKTISCRSTVFGGLIHCGKCLPCKSRINGFNTCQRVIEDPTIYWDRNAEAEKVNYGNGEGTVIFDKSVKSNKDGLTKETPMFVSVKNKPNPNKDNGGLTITKEELIHEPINAKTIKQEIHNAEKEKEILSANSDSVKFRYLEFKETFSDYALPRWDDLDVKQKLQFHYTILRGN